MQCSLYKRLKTKAVLRINNIGGILSLAPARVTKQIPDMCIQAPSIGVDRPKNSPKRSQEKTRDQINANTISPGTPKTIEFMISKGKSTGM